MMIYFENPNNTEQFISWNGSATFHVGWFEGDAFVPEDIFTVYGKAEADGTQDGRCTIAEAQCEASRHFLILDGKYCGECCEYIEHCTCEEN